MKKLLTVFSISLLFLAGCGTTIHAGTIISKQYTPSYDQTVVMLIGKTPMTMIETEPASYNFQVEYKSGNQYYIETVSVDENLYNQAKVGDYYSPN